MTKKLWPAAAVAALIGLSGLSGTANAGGQNYYYSYAVKFVCGYADYGSSSFWGPVVDGRYATVINVFNPNQHRTRVWADAVATSDHHPQGSMDAPRHFEPYYAHKFDCDDIYHYFGVSHGELLKGFVYFKTEKRLDVVGVYTARDDRSGGPSIDVEQYFGRKVDRHGKAGDLEE